MPDLTRITTSYIETEDRICLAGEVDAKETITLWLTQRLMKVLLKHLFSWLDQKIARSLKQGEKKGKKEKFSLNHLGDEAVQGFSQEVAISHLAPQPPVSVGIKTRELLVSSLELKTGECGVQLIFKPAEAVDEDVVMRLTMEEQALRQWLHILQEQWKKAEWDLGLWPDWMLEASNLKSLPLGKTLH